MKKRVFISFDYDHDKALKEFIVAQAKLPDSPFEIIDTSLKEEAPQAQWEARAENRIRNSDKVLVMVGPYTHRAPGVLKEVGFARKWAKQIFQVIGYRDSSPTPVPNAGLLYKWDWDNLKVLLR